MLPQSLHAVESPLPLEDSHASTHPPVLYRHALESVFAFCTRAELVTVNAVSREFQAAVVSMAPLQWRLHYSAGDLLTRICQSPLRRHVNALFAADYMSNAVLDLPLLSERMPHLRELIASVLLQPSQASPFPQNLVTMELSFKLAGNDDPAPLLAPINASIMSGAGLPRLETLSLHMPEELWVAGCSLAPLVRANQLRHITLRVDSWEAPPMSDAQVCELRALSQLESVRLGWKLNEPLMSRLLASPHSLRWRELHGLPRVTESIAELLASLPLHTLDALDNGLAMPHCDWLAQMPELKHLLLCSACEVPVDTGRILRAISGCAQLCSLTLFDSAEEYGLNFTSKQLSACLPCLPQLRTLRLGGATELKTLAFLVLGNLPRSLTALRLEEFVQQLPVSELKCVLELRELRSLELIDVFDAPLDEADRLMFNPPLRTERMPHLAHFVHKWTA